MELGIPAGAVKEGDGQYQPRGSGMAVTCAQRAGASQRGVDCAVRRLVN